MNSLIEHSRLFFLILSLLFTLNISANDFVNVEEDFYIHTKNHVNNVHRLAEKLISILEAKPEYLKALDIPEGVKFDDDLKKLVREFISLHDFSKINVSKEFLEKYHQGKPIISELYKVYGKFFNDMPQEDKDIINHLVNGTDEKIREEFIAKHKLSGWKIKFLDGFEKLADFIERAENAVTPEEMGRDAYKESGSIKFKIQKGFFEGDLLEQMKLKAKLAEELEDAYSQIAIKYVDYKREVELFKNLLQKSGLGTENFGKYKMFQLFDQFQKATKGVKNFSDLKKFNFSKFLLENENLIKEIIDPKYARQTDFVYKILKKSPEIKKLIDVLGLGVSCAN